MDKDLDEILDSTINQYVEDMGVTNREEFVNAMYILATTSINSLIASLNDEDAGDVLARILQNTASFLDGDRETLGKCQTCDEKDACEEMSKEEKISHSDISGVFH